MWIGCGGFFSYTIPKVQVLISIATATVYGIILNQIQLSPWPRQEGCLKIAEGRKTLNK